MIREYKMRDIEVRYIDEVKGYGVFTNEFIGKDEIVEICKHIVVGDDNFVGFSYQLPNKKIVMPLGYGGIYNHSDEYNILWKPLDENHIQFYSIRDIQPNEELCHNYGKRYWKLSKKNKI